MPEEDKKINSEEIVISPIKITDEEGNEKEVYDKETVEKLMQENKIFKEKDLNFKKLNEKKDKEIGESKESYEQRLSELENAERETKNNFKNSLAEKELSKYPLNEEEKKLVLGFYDNTYVGDKEDLSFEEQIKLKIERTINMHSLNNSHSNNNVFSNGGNRHAIINDPLKSGADSEIGITLQKKLGITEKEIEEFKGVNELDQENSPFDRIQ